MSLRLLAPALAAALFAAPALAHPKIVASTPAAGSAVAPPAVIKLAFDETFVPAFTGLKLSMVSSGGREHPPTTMKLVSVKPGADGRSLVATPKAPLPRGGYRIDWHAVGADTHRVTGAIAFTVR